MKLMSLGLMTAALALSFAAGFGVRDQRGEASTGESPAGRPHVSRTDPAPVPVREAQPIAPTVVYVTAPASSSRIDPSSWQSLWSHLTDSSHSEGTREAFEGLIALAKSDPKVLDELLRLFKDHRDPETKTLLKSLLSQIGGPVVLDYSMRLAGSTDPAERREGFDLLHRQPAQSSEIRDVLKRALTKETDPLALANAVSALQATAMPPKEAKEVTALVRGLVDHADPMVRRQSIMTLARWDGSGAFVEPLRHALADESSEVRQAAIWAAAESGNRSDAVKSALLSVAYDGHESPEIRQSAMHALERFPLNGDEYAAYTQAQSSLAEAPHGNGPTGRP
jgi:HEAT repeat protein